MGHTKSTLQNPTVGPKGLDKDCEQLIVRTKTKSWQYELYHILLEIPDIQLYLFGNCRIGNFEPDYRKKIQDEKSSVLHCVKLFDIALDSWHRINLYFQLPANHHTPKLLTKLKPGSRTFALKMLSRKMPIY